MCMNKKKERFWEIDLIKGIAFFGMAFYHICFFFDFFSLSDFSSLIGEKNLEYIGQIVRILFLGSAGILLGLAEERRRNKKEAYYVFLADRWKRVFSILLGAVLLSIGSLFLFPQYPIIFGVLHCIGVSIFLLSMISFSFFFLWTIAIFSLLLAVVKDFVVFSQMPIFLGIITGFQLPHFGMIDYFPLFPWLGVIAIGVLFGRILYPKGQRRTKGEYFSHRKFFAVFEFFGKNSLFWYLAHIVLLGIFGSLFLLFQPN
jgi:uncharacterized membrane protein